MEERGVGRFDGGDGLHSQFGSAVGDLQSLGPGVGGVGLAPVLALEATAGRITSQKIWREQ